MMRNTLRKISGLLLCLVLILSLVPYALAAGGTEEYKAVLCEEDVIVGFPDADPPLTIDTPYKYALIELQKEFPARLSVQTGGTVFYLPDGTIHHTAPAVTRDIDITWTCAEDYDDDDPDVFHFLPVLDTLELAEGVVPPVITVRILGRIARPPMPELAEEPELFQQDADVYYAPEAPSVSGLPSKYDGFSAGVLPPVRDQNPYGSCWAFGTIAAVEADLIHDGVYGTDIDLSELHLAYFNYHDFYDEKRCNTGDHVFLDGANYLDAGGSPTNAAMDLANLLGPVPEASAPYSQAANYAPDPVEGRSGTLQINNVYRCPFSNRAVVKHAILDHGAAFTSYNDQDKYYSATYNSYYHPISTGTNHIIAIVGWDDDFSRNNFRRGTPEGDGAWLVRNSWGVNSYNHGGYFWLSYYDKSLFEIATAFDVAPSRYQHIYAYDNMPTLWFWNIENGSAIEQEFQIDGGEDILAVGVYCETPNADLDFTVMCGNVYREAKLHVGVPGYYVVPFESPLPIIEASEVTVQYLIHASTDTLRVNAEGPGFYSPMINFKFYDIVYSSNRGSGLIVDGDLKDKDARIKLFTNDMAEKYTPDFVLPNDLTLVGADAFSGSFVYAKLPDMPVTIGPRAFARCPNLAYIHIPAQVTNISPDAFDGLSDLTILGIDGSAADSFAREHGFRFMTVVDAGSSEGTDDSNG